MTDASLPPPEPIITTEDEIPSTNQQKAALHLKVWFWIRGRSRRIRRYFQSHHSQVRNIIAGMLYFIGWAGAAWASLWFFGAQGLAVIISYIAVFLVFTALLSLIVRTVETPEGNALDREIKDKIKDIRWGRGQAQTTTATPTPA